MTGLSELRSVCNQMNGQFYEPGDLEPGGEHREPMELDDGVYVCDMGKSSFTYFRSSEVDHVDRDEVVIREEETDNRFGDISPYEVRSDGSTLTVEGVDGNYYDGYTNHRLRDATVRIHSFDGALEVEETRTL